ncbi:RIMS-binding protein 2 isoform X3 [Alosa sapidissima]|uniref:RIMS-binding protein 2 isoform X3 n=1 Tax=Alosa sapidissima TaxID=34773 RepID=UPI001C0A3CA6|nr:RIMS-binding protein 2 isoform X3 [Alosa sapidissima]
MTSLLTGTVPGAVVHFGQVRSEIVMRGRGHRSVDVEELLRQSQAELLWIQRQLSIISARNARHTRAKDRLRHEVAPQHVSTLSPQNVNLCQLLEDRNQDLKRELATLKQEKQRYKSLETEVRERRAKCRALEKEVKSTCLSCQTLSELHDALQERNRLNLQLLSHSLKAAQYEQVKSDYEQLRETFGTVTQERDLARQEKNQLQDQLENLEQVLKHMREAADRTQQLEAEHDQALAVLSTKQQEIHLLQKAQVEAEKEHEGAVHVLEVKVRNLEQKCRSQSEQFTLLSKELHKFRVEADTVDILSADPSPVLKAAHLPEKNLSLTVNGRPSQPGKGNERPAGSPLKAETPHPLPAAAAAAARHKPESLSVKPIILTRSRPSSPQRAGPSEMEDEVSPSPRSKPRYTGQVRLCTARYSYNPYDGPNEHPEAELPLVAGKYLYVYGTMDDDGFYEGELLDGQRGLVPSNFVEFIQDKEKPPAEGGDDLGPLERSRLGLGSGDGAGGLGGPLDSLGMGDPLGPCSNGTGGPQEGDELSDNVVPYPRRLTLIKQLARSVIVAWEPPQVPLGWGSGAAGTGAGGGGGGVSGYNVLVDGEVRSSVPFGGRTKLLLEKLDLAAATYRVSVQSLTERGPSDELRCSLLVGCGVTVAPCGLRVDNIMLDSAELSWLPSNSNYAHAIYLDGVEQAVVRPCCYRYRFTGLKATTVYKVRVVAKPHQMPWQLPLEQREKKEVGVEFCTQAAVQTCQGPPLPPQEVQVQCGPGPGVLQVSWKPPLLTPMGTSNGANVIGYAVCTKGQKIAEVMFPLADYVTVELNRIQCLEAREVVVRTLSAQGESQDSPVATIPNNLLVPPPGAPHQHPHPHPHAPPPHLQSPLRPQPQPMPPHQHPGPQQPQPQMQPHPPPHAPPHPVPQPSPSHFQPLPQQPPRHLPPHPPHPHPQPPPHLHPLPPHPGPQPQPHIPMPQPHIPQLAHPAPGHPQRPLSARELETKEPGLPGGPPGAGHHGPPGGQQPWEPLRSPSGGPMPRGPAHGHMLEAPAHPNRRSPSPQRILPQPRGTLIPDTVAKAIAREAAQRVAAENGRIERRSQPFHQQGSDEEEDEEGYGQGRRRGASVDDFLRGSELGRQPQYSQGEEYHTESSRGSDLSDIMEEDEEELYSEMQLEEGRRRNSHNTLKGSPSSGRLERGDNRRQGHGGPQPQRRPLMVPSIEITTESNSEGNLSPVMEDVYYGRVARHRTWSSRRGGPRPAYDGYRDRDRRSPPYYDESEPEDQCRIFVALFDYDPLSMSPNPDAAEEELPFKEGQIIRVYGDKDTDGFYRGEIRDRSGLIPCNMVSEIRAEDEETREQLLKQGFLSLNTPVDKIEQNRRGGRHAVATRRMVALYDYDPRESSPNVDVEAELTFCAGDIIAVFGEIDEDGFYYGEINGHRGLVPSNFLEEVPDDVEVYLTDTPPRGGQPAEPEAEAAPVPPPQAEAKRQVPVETAPSPGRPASPIVRPQLVPIPMRPLSPIRGPQDLASKKKKGLLSKGKKLLKKFSAAK